ncbi:MULTISPECIES: DUF6906 family protein [Bacillus cereus group]|uniref:DUF6906 family protein n=1 Tax=Bacillus cereus group TaxID=86661 RepID=UPI000AB0453F|nr:MULTISPECIES: hypothetical protein [Bacillus cereus group]MDA2109975.1 hypothetical protein [Bacillus cereus]MDA2149708.1 hypothetical protein [Bacillus cereus]MDA2614237.1 hypothetical protein [Bacillus cereus]MEB8552169.1 hypothetical protein [Bacillus cereus]MEB8726267.1 hypothetical protein [Bacillus cereus]
MKNGKKPNKREKIHIQSHDLNSEDWLIYKKVNGEMHLVHRTNGATRKIPNL